MKQLIRLIAVLGAIIMIACTAACTDVPKGSDDPLSKTPTGTEVYIDVTDAPTEVATTEVESTETTASVGKTSTDAEYKSELTAQQWNLSAVYKDGEQQSIGVQYGSVIRETGAYIKFNDDDTFECVLGIPGCRGTYAVENGDIALHITTKFGAKTEECDEHQTVKWDHEADALSFDFNDVTNVFTK